MFKNKDLVQNSKYLNVIKLISKIYSKYNDNLCRKIKVFLTHLMNTKNRWFCTKTKSKYLTK